MKRISIIIVIAVFGLIVNAQNSLGKSDDLGRIAITPYVSDQIENFPDAAKNMLANKLARILTSNGLSGMGSSRFIMTANVVVLDKNITATAPPMHAYVLETSLFIADPIEKKAYSSISFTIKGVDINETKAYMSALKNIKTNNPKFKPFLEEGKQKIIEYYNKECDFIIKRAQTLSDQNKHEEAIAVLTGVPEVCDECFSKAMSAVKPIYKQFIDIDCEKRLMKARSIWAATQNYSGAQGVADVLSGIDPEARCYREAEDFVKEVKSKISQVDKREWDFELKKLDLKAEKEAAAINAYRDVGVAYGEGQPQSVTHNLKGWLW